MIIITIIIIIIIWDETQELKSIEKKVPETVAAELKKQQKHLEEAGLL